ncbi:MAG: hypothetical protein IJC38_02205 [Erysipelotrichaceae bacterium]|nr:hypothetical protein [Erysipelotrichaceae bacterium]
MNFKKYFPFSFTEKKDVTAAVINVVLHIVASWIIGILLGILSLVPVVGWFTGIAGMIAEVYLFVGMVLSVLDYCKVLK